MSKRSLDCIIQDLKLPKNREENRLLIRDKISQNTYDSEFSDETRHDETYSFTYQQNN